MSDGTAPVTWLQAFEAGLLPPEDLQLAIQFFGGLPEGLIKKDDYERFKKRVEGE